MFNKTIHTFNSVCKLVWYTFKMENVFDFLKQYSIPYKLHEHVAVFGVNDARDVYQGIEFGENKNLFLRNRKGNKHYLVTLPAFKQISLDDLAEKLDEKDLSFASEERLKKYLNVTRGSVSPFGLLNDAEKEVVFVLDIELLDNDHLGFHPNINTQTVVLKSGDFRMCIEKMGNKVLYLKI